ncbi:MAG: hypothetical protein COV67_04865 [Nitrospinae bacterium CG11_big_fil_rev_8_21_14_0_20_56_8]|nr:MAG: hypothetical protein COV67_04865 [Nitrospinae bacterium CG11_big_fil_rev_8_21_14_0_20_56_8]
MTAEQKFQFLKENPLLQHLEDDTLRKLAEEGREIPLPDGKTLFREGSLEKEIYLILSGALAVIKEVKQVAILKTGETVGEMALIEAKPRSASARAVGDAVLLEFKAEAFQSLFLSDAQGLNSILKLLSARIRNDLETMIADYSRMKFFLHDIKGILIPIDQARRQALVLNTLDPGRFKDDGAAEEIEAVKTGLQKITGASENLKTLIDHFLNQTRKIHHQYVRVPQLLLPLVNRVVEDFVPHPLFRGKTIDIELKGKDREALLNEIDIRRVLNNLLINAGEATTEGGSIVVHLQPGPQSYQVSVRDNGEGIPEEIREYLLKASTTSKMEGHGLGLLSCKYIIEDLHHGRLWFESIPEGGTVFHFTLPEE